MNMEQFSTGLHRWCEVLYGRLIVIRDETLKEEYVEDVITFTTIFTLQVFYFPKLRIHFLHSCMNNSIVYKLCVSSFF